MCQTKGVCPQCSSAMSIGKKKDVFAFRCKNCKGSLSMRHGGFLEAATSATGHFCGMSERAVSDWCTLVKEAISVYLRHTPVILGGPKEFGYADGIWIGTTQKYGKGNPNRGMRNKKGKRVLLLLLAEEKSARIQIRVIQSESKNEVHPILAECFANGTEIQTDSVGCFLNLDKITDRYGECKEFLTGGMVNHSKGEFARRENGHLISSNKCERKNGLLKRFLSSRNGFPLHTVFLACDMFVYHTNEGDSAVADLEKFMGHVGRYSQATIETEEKLAGYSLYYSETLRKSWADFCHCDATTPKGCTCAVGDNLMDIGDNQVKE
ncbi:hypothetical protein BV898_19815 [Hypsibius exemplaris]|uniref:ISXO2-like transposase domain-containing protein n=1 Tax=Hypsibius exemplaris TaxID=2072580 RepID=A0A9X6RPF5_HYPEX|nr:hypothetical protein BV898_19815 [Hypsibius exemplaris]